MLMIAGGFYQLILIMANAQDSALLVLMLPMQVLHNGSRCWITKRNNAAFGLAARIN